MTHFLFLAVMGTIFSLLKSTSASATCDALASVSNIPIESYLSLDYDSDQHEYWSASCSILLPACILVPSTTGQVSKIVSTLLTNNETFAVKGGGHNPNVYYSSVSGGPLINLKGLNEVVYDPETSTAKVGPGNRWTDVATALEPYGVTAVGGRIGHVGVGGYIIGGGLSYLSSQYGWAMDNVIEFEVVLANASIITATATHNADLFNVLRGGGNNFGIVTTYTLKVYPMGPVWAGNMIFTSDQTDDVLVAIRDFTEYYPTDKAAIIATHEITLATLVDIWIIFIFYDGDLPPAGTFDNFTAIGPIINTCGPTTYVDFISSEDDVVITGQVYQILTEMSPLPNTTVGLEVFGSYSNEYTNVIHSYSSVFGLTGTMAWQPLPKRIAQHALDNGGDLLDLDISVDRMLMEFDFSYSLPADDPKMNGAIIELFSGVRERVLAFMANGTIPNAYVPLFMNDANWQQDYFGRLRPEKLELAKEVREEVDPGDFFRDRTGGFKIV